MKIFKFSKKESYKILFLLYTVLNNFFLIAFSIKAYNFCAINGMDTYISGIRPTIFFLYSFFDNDYKIILLFFLILIISYFEFYVNEKISSFSLRIIFSIFFIELSVVFASTFYYGMMALSFFYSKTTQRAPIDLWIVYFLILNILHGIPAISFYISYNLLNKPKIEQSQ